MFDGGMPLSMLSTCALPTRFAIHPGVHIRTKTASATEVAERFSRPWPRIIGLLTLTLFPWPGTDGLT
ncbi:MAG: hypothetical protein WBC95_09330, partial [Albidovulum sp.]